MPSARLCALFTTSLVGFLTACSEPIDPQQLSAQTSLQASGVLRSAGAGLAWTDDEDGFVSKVSRGADDVSKGFSAVPLTSNPVARMFMGGAIGGRIGRREAGRPPGLQALTDDSVEAEFDRLAEDVRVFLRDRVLVPSNLESKDDHHATFLLHPDPTCRGLPSSGSTEIDPDCAADLAKLEVRADLSRDGDGGRIRWLIGKERAELGALVIHSDLIAAEANLPETKRAVDIADATLGSAGKTFGSGGRVATKSFAGRVRFALGKDGERKVTFAFSVLDMIDIQVDDDMGAPIAYLRTEARKEPVASATFDGGEQALTLTANLGLTETRDAWDPRGTGARNADLRLVLGGLTARTTLSDRTDELVVTGLGLGEGPTHMDVRGKTIFQLDLNPDMLRRFDLRATATPTGGVRWEVAPRFDLSLLYKLGAVAADYDSPPASYLLDETYRVLLAGADKPTVESVAEDAAKMFAGGIRIAAGSLTLSSSKAAEPVVVPEGKCLTSAAAAPGAHPVLGTLRVVDCPI